MIYPKQLSRFVIVSACVAMVLATSSCQPTQPQISRQTNAPMTAAADDAGKRAEQERKEQLQSYSEAMTNGAQLMESAAFREAAKYFQQALSVAQDLADPTKENDAREKVITAVRSLSVAPAIPEEARRYGVRGETIMNSAHNAADFRRAATEFEAAATIAPWWGSAYYNLGLVREGAKDARGAIAAFALFLKAEPDAPEAAAIRDRIYALEIAAEEQAKINAMVGNWRSEAGTLIQADLEDGQLVMTMIEVSKKGIKNGYYRGQTYFEGKWSGTEAVGHETMTHNYKALGAHRDFPKCFGDFGKYKATARPTGPDELTIQINDRMVSKFNPTTCETLETMPRKFKIIFTRVRSGSVGSRARTNKVDLASLAGIWISRWDYGPWIEETIYDFLPMGNDGVKFKYQQTRIVKKQNDQSEIKTAPHEGYITGSFDGLQIKGTQYSRNLPEPNHSCEDPGSTRPIVGSISDDLTRITLTLPPAKIFIVSQCKWMNVDEGSFILER